ncbi:MAG: glycogen synthase GlgA [Candidatus Alcyoniella australis]|nr:glycogen synthase GlgA [Candidatus Alcyoniella australis]
MAKRRLRILIACSEVAPFSKTGGLGDVCNALPKALVELGHEVRVISPLYRMVRQSGFGLVRAAQDIEISQDDRIEMGHVRLAEDFTDFMAVFVENDRYYDRDGIYGTPQGDHPDNAARFAFFAKMVLEYCREFDYIPDVIHCHDWPTGLIPALLTYASALDSRCRHISSVFTIHNLGYQGLFPYENLELFGLPPETWQIDGVEYHGKLSLLKAGIVYSQMITTVSRRYAKEIQSEELGMGMDGILRKHGDALRGIVNGVDYDQWSPNHDPYIASNYTRSKTVGKKRCKADLLDEFGLPQRLTARPLIGMVTRLAEQKGCDILAEAIDELVKLDLGLVVLGKGEEQYNRLFAKLAKRHPDHVGVRIAFDEAVAHKIEAGSDYFLMPSRYEPCGLNQLYSMRYGTIPIVRATGGLDDTVREYDPQTGRGTGFKFEEYSAQALVEAVRRATGFYRKRVHFRKLIDNAMAADFSWKRSAKRYEEVYRQALADRHF